MNRRDTLGAMAVLLTPACSDLMREKRLTMLSISPEYTPVEVEQIVSALEEWTTALDLEPIPAMISTENIGGIISPKDKADQYCAGRGGTHNGHSYSLPPRIITCVTEQDRPEFFRVVVLHELGHALSLRHDHLPKGNVMYQDGISGGSLTEADVAWALAGIDEADS